MDALKDLLDLFLVLVGMIMVAILIYKFWWVALLLVAATVGLLAIKYVVNGRLRE